MTDARVLGISAPLRLSGDVEGSPGVTLATPLGRISLPSGVIVAKRHIHMTPEDAAHFGVRDKQVVRLQTYTQRPAIFGDTIVRVSPGFETSAHLDYDEANACGFQAGDLGRLLT